MTQRISGKEVKTFVGPFQVNFESMSLNIEDGRTPVMTNGVPDGYVEGDMKADGELEIDSVNFAILSTYAKTKGSWKAIGPIDITSVAIANGGAFKSTAYGCILKITDLLNAEAAGGDKLKHKISFEVTSPDFVDFNGVPYLDAIETLGLF